MSSKQEGKNSQALREVAIAVSSWKCVHGLEEEASAALQSGQITYDEKRDYDLYLQVFNTKYLEQTLGVSSVSPQDNFNSANFTPAFGDYLGHLILKTQEEIVGSTKSDHDRFMLEYRLKTAANAHRAFGKINRSIHPETL